MTPFEIEKARQELLLRISKSTNKTRVLLIHEFISLLIKCDDQLIFESYINEFIDIYLTSLENYTPFYSIPQTTELILDQVRVLSKENALKEVEASLKYIHEKISNELKTLYEILQGDNSSLVLSNKFYFPLLEVTNEKYTGGTLENINIVIKQSHENKFVFVPSSGEIDKNLLIQTNLSLDIARNYFKEFKKIKEAKLEVLIYFENMSAQYAGHSLGIALTLGFIQKLSELFNLPYLTKIQNGIVMTGGINSDQRSIRIEKEIICKKVETVFYSAAQILIIPLENLLDANKKLEKLTAIYPNRKLKVVGINFLDEILNRRDLVVIRKQGILTRGIKGLRRHWVASLIIMSMLFVMGIFAYTNIDNNPNTVDFQGNVLYIKNKSGKTLWTKNVADWVNSIESLKKAVLIDDINNDGKNEVLITSEVFDDDKDFSENYRVACFDNYGQLIWKSFFHDKVTSKREDLSVYYSYSYVIGVVEFNKQKRIYLSTRHSNSFASAIYCLDANTGNRIGSSLWNSGYIGDGLIYDLDKDSKHELIFTFANNGLKRTGIGVISLADVDGQCPTSDEYRLIDKKIADFIAYILVPNTDYNKYVKIFQNGYILNSLTIREDEKNLIFNSDEGIGEIKLVMSYKLSFDLKTINPFAQAYFTAFRDELVKEGKLKPPFTDTKEYYEIIKSQVENWDGEKFIPFNE